MRRFLKYLVIVVGLVAVFMLGVQLTLGGYEGEFEGGAWALREGTNRLGREHTCEVCLPSEQLEPRHASIECRDDRFQLQPLGDAEVRVNDRPSAGEALRDGDYVRIGMTTLRFRSIVQP